MKISVFGLIYKEIQETFEVKTNDIEEGCVEAEELWIAKHGSPECIDSEELADD